MDVNDLEIESDYNNKEKFITKYIKFINVLMKIYIVFCLVLSTFLFIEIGRVAIFIIMFIIINFIIALIYFISKSTYYRFIVHLFFIFFVFLILSMYLQQ